MKEIQFLWKLKCNLTEDYVGLMAAGMAFYFLLASFPVLTAAISLYGIFSNPHFITEQLSAISPFIPRDAFSIISEQARNIISSSEETLSASFFISILFSLYAAKQGVSAAMQGFNIAYNEKEKRGFFVFNVTSFFLTLNIMLYYLISLSLIAGLPTLAHLIHIPPSLEQIFLWVRWPLLFATALIGLQILYFFGPSHTYPRWQWISWGSVVATILWLVASGLFSFFVSHFERYNEIYGSISAIILLLLWFWVSALMILLGAEINSLLEHKHRIVIPDNDKPPPLPEKP
ncbi:MAG: YihY/virulence factor BrkB family protein [Micavibrio sp.]